MIYKIEIENFYSIRTRQVLDLRAPGNAPTDTRRLAPCWPGSRERAPKVVAVFGANGSGKSNLLRALSFVSWFVSSSFTLPANARIPYKPFNDDASFQEPTCVKLWLSGNELLNATETVEGAKCQYIYELIIDNGVNQNVLRESIFYWPNSSGRKTRLVERLGDGTVKAGKVFGLSGYGTALEKILRPNASVISTLAQLNHPIASGIAISSSTTTSNILIDKMEIPDEMILEQYIARPELTEELNREVGRIDVGVQDLKVLKRGGGPQLEFFHEGLTVGMPFFMESHGTQQFLKLFPLISDSLEIGGIAIIDELDAAIHSMILPEIIGWYHDPIRNPHNAQLWMSCQNVSLLEELSKDEIVFCEKNRQGRTEVYCLNDVKAVRRDDNYYKKYLGGFYGAVPRIG